MRLIRSQAPEGLQMIEALPQKKFKIFGDCPKVDILSRVGGMHRPKTSTEHGISLSEPSKRVSETEFILRRCIVVLSS